MKANIGQSGRVDEWFGSLGEGAINTVPGDVFGSTLQEEAKDIGSDPQWRLSEYL